MPKKAWIGIALGGVVVLAFGVSFLLRHRPQQAERVKLVLAFRPTVVVDLALLRAVESGEFANAGIDVTLKPYGRADLLFAALQSNEIQGSAGVPLEPLLGMATKGDYPYRGYLVWYFDGTNPYDGFLVPKDSPINSLADLDGRAVGSHPSRQVKYFVSRMLPHATIQEYNPATPLLAVMSGDQAAAYVLEPAISLALASGEYRLIEACAISRQVFGGARVPAALSLLSSTWIDEHPTHAAAFVRIARAAHERELRHHDTAADVALLGRREYGGYSADVASRVVEPASSTPENLDRDRLRQFFQVLREGRLLDGDVDFERLLYVPPPR